MEITQFTIQIIILGIPGIFCFFVASKLVGRIGKDKFDAFLAIFLFSVLSYVIYSLGVEIYNLIVCVKTDNNILSNLITDQNNIRAIDILLATISSFILALIISYIYNFNLLNRFAQIIRATKRYGDEDVWHYFHNIHSPKISDWFVVRNLERDLMYSGNITTYSETDKERELLIKEVDVYKNSTGEYMYSADEVYLSLDKNNITIEINPKDKYQRTNG